MWSVSCLRSPEAVVANHASGRCDKNSRIGVGSYGDEDRDSTRTCGSEKLVEGRDSALQPALDHAGSWHGGAAQAEERKGAADWYWRAWCPAGALFGGCGSRQTGPGGF